MNKNFVITGSAGYLGKDIVLELLKYGSNVLSFSSKDFAQDIDNENFTHFTCDISNEQNELEIHLSDFVKKFGKIDGFVHLASRGTRQVDLNLISEEFARDLVEAPKTLWSTLMKIKPYVNTGSCSIVIFGSLWGTHIPIPKMYLDLKNEPSISLPASRAALRQIVKYLAVIWAKENIRCNLIIPGWFPKPGNTERPDYMKEITGRIPMERVGIPQDIVGPTLFLLSDHSKYMTGTEIIVDGGYSLH
jgi:NAD(P)-dependent dehydrogenase (short-subunit alcohol dehydrogenase family)